MCVCVCARARACVRAFVCVCARACLCIRVERARAFGIRVHRACACIRARIHVFVCVVGAAYEMQLCGSSHHFAVYMCACARVHLLSSAKGKQGRDREKRGIENQVAQRLREGERRRRERERERGRERGREGEYVKGKRREFGERETLDVLGQEEGARQAANQQQPHPTLVDCNDIESY
jgi:hypothetical protein